mgnify:CR=1 FL=1
MRSENLFLAVLLLNVFSYITIVLRPKLFGVELYRPMIKNFKLSILPFIVLLLNFAVFIILSYISITRPALRTFAIGVYFVGLVVWLLLLPNSGYLITELNLNHRSIENDEVPIWYDIVSILSFALSGIVNTLGNIVLIQLTYMVYLDPPTITTKMQWMLVLSAVLLNILVSIGVYLGRYIRFNSWDIIKVHRFIMKLVTRFKEKGAIKNFGLFILFHTVFFMIVYVMLGIPFYWSL